MEYEDLFYDPKKGFNVNLTLVTSAIEAQAKLDTILGLLVELKSQMTGIDEDEILEDVNNRIAFYKVENFEKYSQDKPQ